MPATVNQTRDVIDVDALPETQRNQEVIDVDANPTEARCANPTQARARAQARAAARNVIDLDELTAKNPIQDWCTRVVDDLYSGIPTLKRLAPRAEIRLSAPTLSSGAGVLLGMMKALSRDNPETLLASLENGCECVLPPHIAFFATSGKLKTYFKM